MLEYSVVQTQNLACTMKKVIEYANFTSVFSKQLSLQFLNEKKTKGRSREAEKH